MDINSRFQPDVQKNEYHPPNLARFLNLKRPLQITKKNKLLVNLG